MINKIKLLGRNKKLEQKNDLLETKFDVPVRESQLERAQAACSSDKEFQSTGIVHELRKEHKSLKRKLESANNFKEAYDSKLKEIEILSSALTENVIERKIARTELDYFTRVLIHRTFQCGLFGAHNVKFLALIIHLVLNNPSQKSGTGHILCVLFGVQ